jgi:aryl-alcohol dehydrogenase-like predicted oxidoreductase
MQCRPFGRTGLQVPVLGFGAMQAGDPRVSEEHAARLLNRALDLGFTLIDTARSYGLSEERIGRHLLRRRDEFVLSTKVGYGVAGLRDWTYECVVAGVDAARERLRTDVIDIVHLHSCGLELLADGAVADALEHCRAAGKLRVAAYSGDAAALRYAISSGAFGSVQASLNVCDQQAARALSEAHACGLGTIAKRPLAGQPWRHDAPPGEPAHTEYWRRFALLRPEFDCIVEDGDWEALALRYAAYAPGVDCAIVGSTDPRHLERNKAAIAAGPLEPGQRDKVRTAFARVGAAWQGQI